MELIFYNIFLILFKAGVRIAAIFNIKAKKWVQGRKGIWRRLEAEVKSQMSEVIWVHCASLGEFEQGRPVIEKLKSGYPNARLLLTFFSSSGYEIRKNYKEADWVFYLPMDGPKNAKLFLETVKPALVIFVKYELWFYYLKEIKRRNIPSLLISALFREEANFFKWHGGLQRKTLSFFDHVFVQTESSKKLLDNIGLENKSSICGDTRFDRVIEIAEQFIPIPVIGQFVGNSNAIVAGSTWPEDEKVLQKTMETINDRSLKLIVAPHEITKDHITDLQKLFPDAVLYSQLEAANSKEQTPGVLIVDNIGMLSRLYNYATITFIGGGFGKGIHNTLEAAVYGKPVLFGPAYQKFNEAIDLVNNGGAISINNAEDCANAIHELIGNNSVYENSCERSKEYVYTNRGATEKIMKFIQEKRLLTK